MSVKVMAMVWRNALDLKGNDLVVMLALADIATRCLRAQALYQIDFVVVNYLQRVRANPGRGKSRE